MLADPDYVAVRVYRSVEFEDTESQLQAERRSADALSRAESLAAEERDRDPGSNAGLIRDGHDEMGPPHPHPRGASRPEQVATQCPGSGARPAGALFRPAIGCTERKARR